ncbi:MAG: hypothetical protein DWQ42_13575 [Planctomycetota bacterium]|nr:MAG: hypothetical protein DWQ42_13575 [Planctomycetota bacterium]REK49399.1 MAG: hypothetical protein DWQ46_00170 [Planctomycetota bacterium]
MAKKRRRRPPRKRVGSVSYYEYHSAWWIYYRDGNKQVRRRVADNEETAAQVAAQVNGQLAIGAPTPFSFTAVTIAELRGRFLDYHEHVVRSSLATVQRYSSATRHLEDWAKTRSSRVKAHEVDADDFVRYLRKRRVACNGHPNASKRPLRDKGIRFVIDTCRSLYNFAAKKRYLPPYYENPFSGLGGRRCRIEDAKPIYVFDSDAELAFLKAADDWNFGIHFTLAKTGLRPGELVHLLIEDLDLDDGWLYVRNKPDLGWRIKTGRERLVPLVDELAGVLRRVVAGRTAGPVFLRQKFSARDNGVYGTNRKHLSGIFARRLNEAEKESGQALSRQEHARVARALWADAGAVIPDRMRNGFIRIAKSCGLQDATCPKSWRHTFATLLQDANVDPLVRQLTLGHSPTSGTGAGLGMTAIYTHTRSETLKREIERAVRLWPASLAFAQRWSAANEGGQKKHNPGSEQTGGTEGDKSHG